MFDADSIGLVKVADPEGGSRQLPMSAPSSAAITVAE